jgi:hypothetical protein
MTGQRSAQAALTALIITLGLVRIGAAQQPAALDVVLARLGAYLLDYETKVFELVAEERYKQWVKRRSGYGGDTILRRNLRSTYFLVRLPDGHAWFGFRDVVHVDGRDVTREGRPMAQVLSERTASAYDEALAIMRGNAKYNIGDIYRTINVPLQALDLLHPQNRTRLDFHADGRGRVGDQEAAIVAFQERSVPTLPTLVSDGFGGELLARGRVWIEPSCPASSSSTGSWTRSSARRASARRDPASGTSPSPERPSCADAAASRSSSALARRSARVARSASSPGAGAACSISASCARSSSASRARASRSSVSCDSSRSTARQCS